MRKPSGGCPRCRRRSLMSASIPATTGVEAWKGETPQRRAERGPAPPPDGPALTEVPDTQGSGSRLVTTQ